MDWVTLQRLLGIFVREREAQKALRLLRDMKLKLDGFRLQRIAEVIGIPLIHMPSVQDAKILRKELREFEVKEAAFEPIHGRPRNIRDAVGVKIPANLVSELPRSFDIVGDIAIIELSHKLEAYSLEVGNGVLQVNPHVRLVMKKAGEVEGLFRTRDLQVLAGSGTTETVHREFGCNYRLDTSRVYFNPRLAQERRRVAKQVGASEVVVDMFAGVGPYAILIAKLQQNSRVYAMDVNPAAFSYLKENILLNHVADHVIPLLGDARTLSRNTLHGTADRVIMNLPSEAEHYLDAAAENLKPTGGQIHFYQFAQRGIELSSAKKRFEQLMLAHKRHVKTFGYCDVVREISPCRVQVAIDAFVT